MNDQNLSAEVELILKREVPSETQNIHIEVNDGVVTLSGNIEHRAAKFAIETAVTQETSARDVVSQLRVRGSWDNESISAREARIHDPAQNGT